MIDPRIKEYNDYFTIDPNKWVDDNKDRFTFYHIGKLFATYPERLLDIGCGNGHTLQILNGKWPLTEYWGLDISDMAIDLAKKRNPHATFLCYPFEDVVLPKFDMIVSIGTFEHFEDLNQAFIHLKKLIKGYAYIEVPNCIGYPSSEKKEGYRRLNTGSRQIEWHLYRSTWEQKIKEAGLEIVQSVTGLNMFSEFIWVLR